MRRRKEKPAATDNYDELYARYLQAARTSTPAATGKDISVDERPGDRSAGPPGQRSGHDPGDREHVGGRHGGLLAGQEEQRQRVRHAADRASRRRFRAISTSLVGAAANTTFKGAGTTSRTSTLTAQLTARVVEVLPNGDLVLEGRPRDRHQRRPADRGADRRAAPERHPAEQRGVFELGRPVADPLLRQGADEGQPAARLADSRAEQGLLET